MSLACVTRRYSYEVPEGQVIGMKNQMPAITGVIRLSSNSAGLSVEMTANNLFLRSIQNTTEDHSHFFETLGDPEVMSTVGSGKALNDEYSKQRAIHYANIWKENIPWSVLFIFGKDKKFAGLIILLQNDPGKIEIVSMVARSQWGQKACSIGVNAVLKGLIPVLMEEGYKVKDKIPHEVIATALKTNKASCHVIEKSGMTFKKEYVREELSKEPRNFYSLDLTNLNKNIKNKSEPSRKEFHGIKSRL